MPRLGLLLAAALAAFALCAGVLAFTLPGLVDDWRAAQAQAPSEWRPPQRSPERPAPPRTPTPGDHGATDWPGLAVTWFSAWAVIGTVGVGGLNYKLVRRRLRNRDTRAYGLYEIHLSMHDQAKAQDLEDMVEALANLVRQFPEDRARDGQPFVAVELHYGPGASGMEWTLGLRCEQKVARALDGVLAAAYPDVRLGHQFGGTPEPLRAQLGEPGYVLRYRKARSFVYALSAERAKEASPPIEAIAQEQVALGRPSSVRIQLTPTPKLIEAWARWRFRRHENKLARSESWGMKEAGLRGTLNQQEMREAKRTQNRSMFWLEVQVAAETKADANAVGGVVQARRAENDLKRRWMIVRVDRYRRRFATAYPPLWPTLSMRALTSSAEIGHLLELPTARMKNVPVRRSTLPRLPAPPEVHPGEPDEPDNWGATANTAAPLPTRTPRRSARGDAGARVFAGRPGAGGSGVATRDKTGERDRHSGAAR
jgi:hypothetical protein